MIAKVYEINPLVCPQCGGDMKVVVVIMDSVEVEKILRHLVKLVFLGNICGIHSFFLDYAFNYISR